LVCRGQRNSLPQGIWQRNFSGSRVKGTISAGLAELRQRVATNSLHLRGREFVRPAQGNVSTLAGNSQGRQGIGTPDQVYAQIVDFCEYCCGMGNLIMMGHAGSLSLEDTVDNLTLFAKEVPPRLKEYKQPQAEVAA
jgi:hypothetical protein